MTLIRNTSWSAVAAVVFTGGRFLLTMLLAKKLGVSEFGRFAFAQWLVDIIFLSFAFGLPGSASRYFAEFQTQPGKLLAFDRWFLIRSLAVLAAVVIASPLAAMALNDDVTREFVLLQGAWSATAAVWALLVARAQGLLLFKRVAISNATYVLVALFGVVVLLPSDIKAPEAMLMVVAATVVAALSAWVPLPVRKSVPEAGVTAIDRRMMKLFGINVWISSLVAALVWSRGEIVIVQREIGVSGVAIYSVALSLVGIATQGVMLLTGAVGQHLTQMWGAGKNVEAISLCRRFTDLLTFNAGLLSVFLIAFAPELIRFTFGVSYMSATGALTILAIGAIGFTSAAANQLLLLQTNGVFGRNINIVMALCLFILAIPSVGLAGIEGAAFSRMLVQIGAGVLTVCYASRLVSGRAVSRRNLAKISVIILTATVLNSIGQSSFGLRLVGFVLSVSVILYWLRDDDGRYLFRTWLVRLHATYK